MLTAPDDRPDGRRREYLTQGRQYRDCDPELFDWLQQTVGSEQCRQTAKIESSGLLGRAVFQSGILTDGQSQRNAYFTEGVGLFAGCDIVFFDPDNGMEIKSTRPGRKGSCKFLLWNEVVQAFGAGSSVLVYQHFPREKRDTYIARMAEELRQRTDATTICSYRTPHVLFLLACQDKHSKRFCTQLAEIQAHWARRGSDGKRLCHPTAHRLPSRRPEPISLVAKNPVQTCQPSPVPSNRPISRPAAPDFGYNI
jgi:hypothetical protein